MYVKWPKGVPDSRHVVNVYTDNDCVRLSMVAHFCHEEVRNLKNIKDEAKVYKKKLGDYFYFPTDTPTPISIENFDRIEKQTLTDIWLYQISKNNKSHSIRLLRKGKNSFAPPNRVNHHCEIDDSGHLVLIKNIQLFIRCIRPTSFSKKDIETGLSCKICFSYMKINRYSRHYNRCLKFEGVPNIVLLNEGKTFEFTTLLARDKAKFICYYNTESKLTPSNGMKNTIHKHEIILYAYVFVDTDN